MSRASFCTVLCFAASAFGIILRTVDGGYTWNAENSGTFYSLNAVAVDPSSGFAVAVGDRGTIIRRSSAGYWENVSPEGLSSDLRSVAVGADGVCMACGDSGTLLSSFDRGLNWRLWNEFDSGGADLLSVNFDPAHSGSFVITGGNGFAYSSADGRLETGSDSHFIGSCVQLCGSFPEIAVSSSGDIFSFAEGRFIAIGMGNSLNGVTACVSGGSPFIAVGDSCSILILQDYAFSSQVSGCSEDLNGVAVLAFGESICAVGNNGTVIVSADGGISWNRVSSGTHRNLNGIAGNGSGTGYIVGESFLGRFFR